MIQVEVKTYLGLGLPMEELGERSTPLSLSASGEIIVVDKTGLGVDIAKGSLHYTTSNNLQGR